MPVTERLQRRIRKEDERKKKTEEQYDISGIELGDEAEDKVSVDDTCDNIRKKINTFKCTNAFTTQAAFCRTLSEQIHNGPKVVESSLNTFLSTKGPREGASSAVYHAAYVFFEKLGSSRESRRRRRERLRRRSGAFRSMLTIWECRQILIGELSYQGMLMCTW